MAERIEFWWVEIEGASSPEVAEVHFNGDRIVRFFLTGSEIDRDLDEYEVTETDENGKTTVRSEIRFIERVAAPGELAKAQADWSDLNTKTNDRICDLLDQNIMLRRTILTCAKASGMEPETIHKIEKLLEQVAGKEKADV